MAKSRLRTRSFSHILWLNGFFCVTSGRSLAKLVEMRGMIGGAGRNQVQAG